MTILFQGDSITDCGRGNSGGGMGAGYAFMVSSWLGARFPELDLRFVNRGISGNRVNDLVGRWDQDCIALKPDILSILIGINDTWRHYDKGDRTSTEAFYEGYRTILEKARKTVDPLLVICEPFLLPFPDDRRAWRVDLDPKIAAARDLAREYKAIYIPLDGIFAHVSTLSPWKLPCSYWAADGVHPSNYGHALIAQSWLRYVLGLA